MTGTTEADCPFCQRIRDGDYDYFNEHVIAFRPRHPVTDGHFLVVPRRHVADAMTGPTWFARAMWFGALMAKDIGLTDCNFISSAGEAATQTVFHLHVHVIPRRPGDGLALPWTGQQK